MGRAGESSAALASRLSAERSAAALGQSPSELFAATGIMFDFLKWSAPPAPRVPLASPRAIGALQSLSAYASCCCCCLHRHRLVCHTSQLLSQRHPPSPWPASTPLLSHSRPQPPPGSSEGKRIIRARAAAAVPPLPVVPGWTVRDWESAAVRLQLAASPCHVALPGVARGARVAWGGGRVYLFLCAPAPAPTHGPTPGGGGPTRTFAPIQPSTCALSSPPIGPIGFLFISAQCFRFSFRFLSTLSPVRSLCLCPLPRSPSPTDRFVSLAAVRSGSLSTISWETTYHSLEEARDAAAAAPPPSREDDRVGLPEALNADAAFMKGPLSPGEAPEEADDLLDLLVAEVRHQRAAPPARCAAQNGALRRCAAFAADMTGLFFPSRADRVILGPMMAPFPRSSVSDGAYPPNLRRISWRTAASRSSPRPSPNWSR